MSKEPESEVQDLDRSLKQLLRPADETIDRVWRRVDAHRRTPADGRPAPPRQAFPRRTLLWAAAAAAAVVVLALAAGMVGSRLQTPDRFATTVLPPQSNPGTSGASGAAYSSIGADRAAVGAPAQSAYSPSFYGGSCSQAPAVQLQGRGLTATGFAALSTAATGSQVGLTVQAQGADAGAAAAAAQSKASAVEGALIKAGLTVNQIQRTSVSVYSGGPPNQANASISLQARVNDAADAPKVITAAVQAGATSAYAGNQLLPDSASDSEVQDAVARATSQAKAIATSTASAAGVQIAQLQTVVAQPPQVCYGPSGAQRVVAVTVSYSVK